MLKIDNLSNFRVNMFTKANGKIIKEMDVELNYGKVGLYMKDIGKIM